MSFIGQVENARNILHRVGNWAGLRFLARQGFPIEVAMMARCGYVPKSLR